MESDTFKSEIAEKIMESDTFKSEIVKRIMESDTFKSEIAENIKVDLKQDLTTIIQRKAEEILGDSNMTDAVFRKMIEAAVENYNNKNNT